MIVIIPVVIYGRQAWEFTAESEIILFKIGDSREEPWKKEAST